MSNVTAPIDPKVAELSATAAEQHERNAAHQGDAARLVLEFRDAGTYMTELAQHIASASEQNTSEHAHQMAWAASVGYAWPAHVTTLTFDKVMMRGPDAPIPGSGGYVGHGGTVFLPLVTEQDYADRDKLLAQGYVVAEQWRVALDVHCNGDRARYPRAAA